MNISSVIFWIPIALLCGGVDTASPEDVQIPAEEEPAPEESPPKEEDSPSEKGGALEEAAPLEKSGEPIEGEAEPPEPLGPEGSESQPNASPMPVFSGEQSIEEHSSSLDSPFMPKSIPSDLLPDPVATPPSIGNTVPKLEDPRWEAPGYALAGMSLAASGYFFWESRSARKDTYEVLEETLKVADPEVQKMRGLVNRSLRYGYFSLALASISGGYIYYSYREISEPPSLSYRMRW